MDTTVDRSASASVARRWEQTTPGSADGFDKVPSTSDGMWGLIDDLSSAFATTAPCATACVPEAERRSAVLVPYAGPVAIDSVISPPSPTLRSRGDEVAHWHRSPSITLILVLGRGDTGPAQPLVDTEHAVPARAMPGTGEPAAA